MTKDYFTYNVGSTLPEDAFRISPSQLSKFFDRTTEWYRENLMGEKGFTGNTSTALGTCVHAGAEMWVKEGKVLEDQIASYIDNLPDNDEYDKDFIRYQYPGMLGTLLSSYLEDHVPEKTEEFMAYEVLPDIYVAGTLDSLITENGITTIVDYKTTSSKTIPKKISRPYWFQQMTYAYIARRNGIKVSNIRLVYVTTAEVGRVSEKTGKPLKDYPTIVDTLEYEIKDDDIEIIENTLKLVAESVAVWKTQPELRYLLAQDLRLKLQPKPTIFK